MNKVDTYIEKVIKRGDKGSALLAKICAPTLKNSEFVEVLEDGMNGVAVLRIPESHVVAVHSSGGDPKQENLKPYAESVVDRLVEQALLIGATPLAFADDINSNTGDISMITEIGGALTEKANRAGLVIMNGENAILGARVSPLYQANISATMISLIDRSSKFNKLDNEDFVRLILGGGTFVGQKDGVNYAVFDPKGEAIYANCDGVGTKVEFYERTRRWELGIEDWMAMVFDDTMKLGARARALSGVAELDEEHYGVFSKIESHTLSFTSRKRGFGNLACIIQQEIVGKRICGFADGKQAYNISGSVVSTIDEERLKNPLKPGAGEHLIAIRGKPTPRSNGITDKRKIAIRLFGENYQDTKEGKLFLEYLAEPSTVLYPVFKELVDNDLATSVYHMSGGAYDSKLAKPLAKHDLFVSIDNLFPPDWRELALVGANFTSAETSYSKWPMGNEGFITTKDPKKAIEMIKQFGLEAIDVGILENAAGEKTGVELKAFNGEKVYFSGRN